MNPLLLALLAQHLGGSLYGSQPNVGLGGSPLLSALLHGIMQSGILHPGAGGDAPPGGLFGHKPVTPLPILHHGPEPVRRPIRRTGPEPVRGTPTLQGFRGNGSFFRNPNEGGFSGLGMSEMTHPGMAAGLYGSNGFGLLPVQ